MEKIIAIRREDKNEWERRAPLIPEHIKELKQKFNIRTIMQPSTLRIYPDQSYQEAGARISEDLSDADIILSVKEIPIKLFSPKKTYVFFSHTIKGQPYNMAMLKQMIRMKTNLIDYERIVNEKNQRLIFFGRFAGIAGMIETLHAYGKKLELKGFTTPLLQIKQAFAYNSLEEAQARIKEIGRELKEKGIPQEIAPLTIGFTGYGNVSRGAQEICDLLPCKEISPQELLKHKQTITSDTQHIYKIVFSEEDMVKHKTGEFDLQQYYNHPELYESTFQSYLPLLEMVVNCIYWTEKYPRLITKEYLKRNVKDSPKLKVIGDISCDVNGSIEITHKATMPDKPAFTYFPERDKFSDGILETGITVMAVDNLPCEFSAESSMEFSTILKEFVPGIVNADFSQRTDNLNLPGPIQRALILHQGEFTPDYQYIKEFLNP